MEIEEFIEELTSWHARQVKELQTVLEHPEARIKFTHSDGDIELPEQQSKGFRLGVHMALSRLGKLPFTVTSSEEE